MTEHPLKDNAKQFIRHIQSISKVAWLGKSRSWWPQFIYHFTNIDNAIKILECGKLQCRSVLENTGNMATDNASAMIIDRTDERWKDYVRLYFRPKTPTQYHNEGFRPVGQRRLESHCPVPVYFLFDFKKMISRKNTSFSHGSLASGTSQIYDDFHSFQNIPFELVYHDTSFDPADRGLRDKIIYHRQAEVVVPKELDLLHLKWILCRSEAEYHTFLDRLDPKVLRKWQNKIGTKDKANLFYKNWIYVDKVDLSDEKIQITFNHPSHSCKPFRMKVVIKEMVTGYRYSWKQDTYTIEDTLELSLSSMQAPHNYKIQLFMDDQIMYSNHYKASDHDLPF